MKTRSGSCQGWTELACHFHQIGERIGLHLLHDFTSMGLHRDLTDAEFAANLFVQQTGDDQGHDLSFARGKGRVTIPELFDLRLLAKSDAAAFEGLPDGAKEHVIVKRLCEKFDSACFHGLHCFWHIAVTCDEDNGYIRVFGRNSFLQLEAIQARHGNVE